MPASRNRSPILPALAAVLIALILGWWSTRPAPALTPDSIQYLSAAQNVAAGHGLTTSVTPLESPRPRIAFTDWPPLYPLLLSLGAHHHGAGGQGAGAPLAWARWLNLLALALSFLPLGWLAARMAGPRGTAPVLAFHAVFRPLLLVASFVWSESLFILFTYSSFCLLLRAMDGKGERETGWFVLAGACAGLASGTRYLGLVGTASAASAIILRTEDPTGARTLRRLASFLIPALLPPALWGARDFLAAGHVGGLGRAPGAPGLEQAVVMTLRALAQDWVRPSPGPLGAQAWWALPLSAISVVWLLVCALRNYGPWTLEGSRRRMDGAVLLLTFVTTYLLALVVSTFWVKPDVVNSRLLAPCEPAQLLLGAALLRRAGGRKTGHPGGAQTFTRAERTGIAAACLCLFALNAVASARFACARRDTQEWTWPYWRTVTAPGGDPRAPAFAYLHLLPRDSVVVSNVWDTVALRTGLPAKPLPGRGDAAFPASLLSHPGAYVLAADGVRPDRVGAHELRSLAASGSIELVRDWDDAHLYRVRHAPPR